MIEIRVKKLEGPHKQLELAQIISHAVTGFSFSNVPYETSPGVWTLDRGNDWWLSFHDAGDATVISITTRYQRKEVLEAMAGLDIWLEWLLKTKMRF